MNMSLNEKSLAALMIAGFLVVSGAALCLAITVGNDGSDTMPRFSSYQELADFIGSGSSFNDSYSSPELGDKQYASDDTQGHSNTNVQVSGVDEADTVKTDGDYIYIASGGSVTIVHAYPPGEMAVAANLSMMDFVSAHNVSVYIRGLFLNGDNLAVIATEYFYQSIYKGLALEVEPIGPRTVVLVFDVTDPQEPVLRYSVGVSGHGIAERMIGANVYVVSQSYAWVSSDGQVNIPRTWVGNDSDLVAPESINYDPATQGADSFVNVLAMNIETSEHEVESIVSGYASTVYMSQGALYMTYQKWTGDAIMLDTVRSALEATDSLTTIYKVSVNGLSMSVVARGDVGGWLLNQFSMDESEGYLRVATTSEWSNMSNRVYVLDGDLETVGSLLSIAPGERIYSARFVGDTLYLVTFRQIDPLFVIDLSTPSHPTILGELTMPGFSSYLHPVDANHVLGIGSENSSVKVSLYDVTDPTNPLEDSKYLVPAYSYSDAQYDHKAVLFDLEKNLLVIPVTTYSWWSPLNGTSAESPSGAYVFDVSLAGGINLRGVVQNDEGRNGSYSYYYSGTFRSLYIGDYLYTISWSSVKATSLGDLSEVGSVAYGTDLPYYGYFVEGLANTG